ncbi:MAG: alpha/beta hydrolase [Nonlabens sp.]|nr:alpha/beta hydrolase [Nonlabens sp.]
MPYLKINGTELSKNVEIYYEDHGKGDPVILVHGWPLSTAMWEYQVPALIEAGKRVIVYDRRGFGKSSQPYSGYDYKTMAADLNELIQHLNLTNVSLVGFSMGGGELAKYVGSYGTDNLSKLVFVSSIAPFMLKTADNPDGVPDDVLKDMENNVKNNRAGFLAEFGKGFVNYESNKDKVSQGQLDYNFNVAAGASPKGTLDCINAFGRTDMRDDLKKVDVPTLFIHGTKDEVVPSKPTSQQGHELVKGSKLEMIDGAPHGLTFTHVAELNKVLVDFLK